ncbi:MAG: RIP metalloprotease [Elusimicrobiaceae bacterium]|nr:RIP metalloprotease [Elusimicrobiaceae bacterium]
MLLSILAVLVVLSPIVIIHEFGHFLACRLTGIRVNEFSFGFGKILWHKKKGDTDYQIRAIPFGGFVEPAGPMFHPEDAKEPPKPYEFAAKPWYSKFFMVVNGALFNYVLAAVIFGVLIFVQGRPQTDPALLPAVVGSVSKDYPAAHLDLQPGDTITSLNGKPVSNWQDLMDLLQARTGDLTLNYTREISCSEIGMRCYHPNQKLPRTLTATVEASDFNPKAPKTLGVTVMPAYEKVSWWKAIGYGAYECYYWTAYSLKSIGQSFAKKKAPELAGPIGIVNIIHQVAHRNLLDFISLIAMLSVAVGMFNLFPIPILDGGYALVYLWEGLTHKLPTQKTLGKAANVGLALLAMLVLYASYSDIKRIFFKPKTVAVETTQTTPQEEPHVQD